MSDLARSDVNHKGVVRPYDAYFNNRRTEVFATSVTEAVEAAARKFATEQTKVVVIPSKY
jgi:hypothetical protein